MGIRTNITYWTHVVVWLLSELMCGCASEQKQFPTIYKPKIDNNITNLLIWCVVQRSCSIKLRVPRQTLPGYKWSHISQVCEHVCVCVFKNMLWFWKNYDGIAFLGTNYYPFSNAKCRNICVSTPTLGCGRTTHNNVVRLQELAMPWPQAEKRSYVMWTYVNPEQNLADQW